MSDRVYNFGPGPAMLPRPVMEKAQAEFLNYQNIGASIIEISHRSKDFDLLLNETDALFKSLLAIPDNFKLLYVHGGAQMQFGAVPLNLMGLKPKGKAIYMDTGRFANLAAKEGGRYGQVEIIASSQASNYDHIPVVDAAAVDQEASYFHITSNNTIFGTRFNSFPSTGGVPLVADMTSELLSRKLDWSKFGLIYAGAQKNLGPSGIAVVIAREDLLGHAHPLTPQLLNYAVYAKDHSLTNTPNTFAIYMIKLVLEWLKGNGGLEQQEKLNGQKAALLYATVDESGWYTSYAQKAHRSVMNVCFNLPSEELLERFLKEAGQQGLYALKGHRDLGGVRASIYNAMPMEGVRALAQFMKEFQRTHG